MNALQLLAKAFEWKSEVICDLGVLGPKSFVILELEIDEAEIVLNVGVTRSQLFCLVQLLYRGIRLARRARKGDPIYEPDDAIVGAKLG